LTPAAESPRVVPRSRTQQLNIVSLSFPIIDFEEPWQWPSPPFSWRHVTPTSIDNEQACQIEAPHGVTVDGHMLRFEPKSNSLIFRSPTTGPAGRLSFAKIRRLTLTAPLEPKPRFVDAPPELVPAAAQERDYRLQPANGEAPITGRTAGYVEAKEGLYLFAPSDEGRSLFRVFVPNSAYKRCEFGRSAQEIAAERWIVSPRELLAAIERQQSMPVLPIGQALLLLGLVTHGQLERALAQHSDDVPLGERLVADGVISNADLQTAIAHKMGYPLVDLTRFPLDPRASDLVPHELALRCRVLPLMKCDRRIIVAVDRPQRVAKLQTLSVLSGLKLVPVLAMKSEIMRALTRPMQRDRWIDNVSFNPAFFRTTV